MWLQSSLSLYQCTLLPVCITATVQLLYVTAILTVTVSVNFMINTSIPQCDCSSQFTFRNTVRSNTKTSCNSDIPRTENNILLSFVFQIFFCHVPNVSRQTECWAIINVHSVHWNAIPFHPHYKYECKTANIYFLPKSKPINFGIRPIS